MSEAFDNVGVMMLLHQKMMRDAEVATAYHFTVANPEEEEPPKKKRKHNWWFRPMLHPQLRAERGQYHTLMNELRENDKRKFKNYTRLSPEMFDDLLIRLTPHLQKKDTHFRKAIPPGLKLCVFLRHLATGATYAELGYNFRVGKETIQKFVPDVARAIVDEYAAEVISLPTTNEGWLQVVGDFEARWNLPHCLGAFDGKHIRIQKPKNSGSLHFNYKQFFSVVLMALVDSKYQFLWIDVGGVGHQSDAQIYNNSELKECIDAGTLGIPDPASLPHDDDDHPMPYFFVGDDAFAMRTYMMKPYGRRNLDQQQKIFNYRLSRARRVVENAFGILALRFQCFLGQMRQEPETVRLLVEAAVMLHNLIRKRYQALDVRMLDQEDAQHNLIPGAWRTAAITEDLNRPIRGNRDSELAKRQRDTLKYYFNSVGAVAWQDKMI